MYWGSGGSYVGTNMRRGFVEKIGHISCGEDLMDKNLPSVLEASEGVTDCGVVVATQAIVHKYLDSEVDSV